MTIMFSLLLLRIARKELIDRATIHALLYSTARRHHEAAAAALSSSSSFPTRVRSAEQLAHYTRSGVRREGVTGSRPGFRRRRIGETRNRKSKPVILYIDLPFAAKY